MSNIGNSDRKNNNSTPKVTKEGKKNLSGSPRQLNQRKNKQGSISASKKPILLIESKQSEDENSPIESEPSLPPNSQTENNSGIFNRMQYYLNLLNVRLTSINLNESKPPTVLKSLNIEGVVDYIKSKCKNIIVMAGAGISVASGVPDFRTPGNGIYSNLSKYSLPYPEAIFSIDYFEKDCRPFFSLAKELYPENFKPTDCHYFFKLLEEKGLLLRIYTQNIDTLELKAGLSEDKIVFAHGSFATNTCLSCSCTYDMNWSKEKILKREIPKCDKKDCDGIVKPDITFFGESLPARYHKLNPIDFPKADLLFIIGTSLKVYPFADLISNVPLECPRILINNEIVGSASETLLERGISGFDWGEENYRDVKIIGDCQKSIGKLVKELGWSNEFEKIKSNSQ